MIRRPPRSTLFPYTTLFRSGAACWGLQRRMRTEGVSRANTLVRIAGFVLVLVASCGLTTLRSEEHTSELQSRLHLVCRLLLEKKKNNTIYTIHHHRLEQLQS